ncbi:MAG: Gfo/Idh/MocA family oxidoreductase, partial [Planctomycetales bacterium]|nr:Gfo/Idh/MocA family oxidoreductase [Planctomycetales bacterium]
LVLLATPPVFRPQHFSAAVEAGKHVLAESPVAVDSPGVRQFLAASELAQQRQLVVASGLTRRFDPAVQQTLEQLHRGAIGSMVMAQVYYHAPLGKLTPRRKSQSELEFQLRNWQHFSWSSGESVVEQQVQNLDVLSWLLGSHPVSARAIVGQHPLAPVDGEIPPGPTVEYTYGGGVKLLSMCGPSRGGWADLSASVQGTEGWCDLATGKIYNGKNELVWQASSSGVNSCAASVERLLLSAADCEGLLLNPSGQEIRASFAARGEGRLAAESTLAAILGRMARQADGELSWAQCAASPHRLANLEALQCLSAPPPAVLANS